MIRSIRLLTSTLLLVIIPWLAGFWYYMRYTRLYKFDNLTVTDILIVTAAEPEPMRLSIDLLKAGYASFLFVPEVIARPEWQDFLSKNNADEKRIIYASGAENREDPISEITRVMIDNGFRSIRIMTFSSQIPLVERKLRNLLPSDILVVFHYLPSPHNYRLLIREYNNYLFSFL